MSVKNFLIESCHTLSLSPRSLKPAKVRAFGAVKEKVKKAPTPKRKFSTDKNQPKIDFFFGVEKKSCALDGQNKIGSEQIDHNL